MDLNGDVAAPRLHQSGILTKLWISQYMSTRDPSPSVSEAHHIAGQTLPGRSTHNLRVKSLITVDMKSGILKLDRLRMWSAILQVKHVASLLISACVGGAERTALLFPPEEEKSLWSSNFELRIARKQTTYTFG